MGLTLAEKVWRDHVVIAGGDGTPDLLYIDLHLVHEVTSPQAFEGLDLAGAAYEWNYARQMLEIRWQGLREIRKYSPEWKQQIDRLYRERSLRRHLAETLFDVGTPIGDIVNELSFMREALLSTASAAGFNRTELEGLIDSLGLSQGAINSLASATADAQRQVVDAAAAEKAKADALAQADANAQATQDAERGNATTIINNIAIPYGDLEAVALAVSNRQASAASRRIRR